MTKNKDTSQTFTLRVLRTQTTLMPGINNAPLAAVSFALLIGKDNQLYRTVHAFTCMGGNDFIHDGAVYPFLRDGDEVKAVLQSGDNNVIKLVENLTLNKTIDKYLNNQKRSR